MDKKNLPPQAKKEPVQLEIHGDVRTDNYFWMNQRDHPEVIQYLQEENNYFQEMTRSTAEFQEYLFEEMKSRIKLKDESVPYFLNGYWYYVRFEEKANYPIYCRKKENLEAKEEILFNVNEMAKGYEFYQIAGIAISPDNKWAAFGRDTLGRRQYRIQFKNLETGEILPAKIENASGSMTWADDETLFYVQKDPETLRPNKVFKHSLKKSVSEDVLIFHEKDEAFHLNLQKSKSKKYIFISAHSSMSDEYWFLETRNHNENFKLFQVRQPQLEYGIEHYEDDFYILTNINSAKNFKLMKTPIQQTSLKNWKEVIPHRENVLLEQMDVFKECMVLTERTTGLTKIRIRSWDGKQDYFIPFESQTYTAAVGNNPEFDSSFIRYVFEGLATPTQVIDFNLHTREAVVVKQQEILDPKFDPQNYFEQRLWAKSEDGTRIPISMVYKKGIQLDGKNPLLLYAYGSYGITIDPSFSSNRLSLLDRGFIFAIAHVRGGEYLGRSWYDSGKLEYKINSFKDFIACSKYLIKQKYTSAEHLYAMGGSAGGMLMGGVLNMAPQLYNGVVVSVPFVDVLTTMLDESLPLTVGEYEEWGNPKEKSAYENMKEYSPYDNVKAQDYPNILVTTGYHDSQVQYWEPAKWVAKLRELKTDQNKLFFHTNMKAGHSGASGRFEALKELAEEYTFLLSLEDGENLEES